MSDSVPTRPDKEKRKEKKDKKDKKSKEEREKRHSRMDVSSSSSSKEIRSTSKKSDMLSSSRRRDKRERILSASTSTEEDPATWHTTPDILSASRRRTCPSATYSVSSAISGPTTISEACCPSSVSSAWSDLERIADSDLRSSGAADVVLIGRPATGKTSLASLLAGIAPPADSSSSSPVRVLTAGPDSGLLGCHLIDTPGLSGRSELDSATAGELDSRDRLIILVKDAAEAAERARERAQGKARGDYVLDAVRNADPSLSRTIVVYTRLSPQLASCPDAAAANALLSGASAAVSPAKAFFLSFPEDTADRSAADKDAAADIALLSRLGADRSWIPSVGAAPLFAAVSAFVRSRRAGQALAALRAAEAREASTGAAAAAAAEATGNRTTEVSLREAAASYASAYADTIVKRLNGDENGDGDDDEGETIEEEREACGVEGVWAEEGGAAINADEDALGKLGPEERMQGGCAIRRLLGEFGAVCSAVGKDKRETGQMRALTNVLLVRAAHIVEKLAEPAGSAAEEAAEEAAGYSAEAGAFFADHVGGVYRDAWEEAVERCRRACEREFIGGRTAGWEKEREGGASDSEVEWERVQGAVGLHVYQAFCVGLAHGVRERVQGAAARLGGEELKEKLGASALQADAEENEIALNAEAADAEEHRKAVQEQAEKIAARTQ